jgi:hypothetical protein
MIEGGVKYIGISRRVPGYQMLVSIYVS